MEYITGTREFQIEEPAVVTLGKFDGRHRGHQKLLKRMAEVKEEKGYKTAVFTFDMSPNALVAGDPQKVITTNLERKNNLEKIGIDYLVEYPFTEETARMEPEEFVRHVLTGQMNARAIVVGTDCSFGYRGAGNAERLSQWKERYGYELTVIPKEQDDHRDISSTYIREQLDAGNMEKANELLGEPYAIHGTVVHGNHIGGAVLGFPTANIIPPPEKHLPVFGVYVSRVYVDGTYYGGITNIGRKPTVEGGSPVGAETFIYGINEDIYGKTIEVQLLHFLRPERRFEGLEQLKAQIENDREYGMRYLRALSDQQITKL
ncbi:bifunctional riboflavin kinase/FAD synthetase [Clostridium sp. Marseille-P2415]|uniref:bifunctional riboflavin kinase/FAD synthetase n=1 Tax=Clostridium sp. Marseille-P2415 TaxID=1805471 RepID=UPI00190E718E|nr:bifunctional riboflavin kinase/FAD synthetase [Clostridium sp. Marseille-P2415]